MSNQFYNVLVSIARPQVQGKGGRCSISISSPASPDSHRPTDETLREQWLSISVTAFPHCVLARDRELRLVAQLCRLLGRFRQYSRKLLPIQAGAKKQSGCLNPSDGLSTHHLVKLSFPQ